MGFRLFRRVRIAPGLSVNLSKGGPSLSVGVRGARVTFGRRGVRRTVGIPGTGISYTETSGDRVASSDGERRESGFGCGTILLGLFLLGLVANQCSPSNGSGYNDRSPNASPSGTPEPSASPTPNTDLPIALSVEALPAVKRSGEVRLVVSAAYGSSCEIGVPLLARTGEGPPVAEMPESGTAVFTWRAGAKAGTSVITVVCTLGDQREALENTLIVK